MLGRSHALSHTANLNVADRAARCAQLLLDAYANGRPFVAPQDPAPADVADAYRVQDIVFAALAPAERPRAWKVGPPPERGEPLASPVPSVRLLRSPVQISAAGIHRLGVEAEIAFRIGRDLPARGTPYGDDELAEAVEEALVLIELVDTRLANWSEASPLWKLADFQSNGAFVIGSGRRDWRGLDFGAQRAELRIGTRKVVAVTGAHPCGDPFRLLPWMAAHCARRSGGLRAGDIVTTGSWTGLEALPAGSEVTARFEGIGEARLEAAT